MNKSIRDAFGKSKAFIPFITAGDPDLETTEKLILALQNAGADLIEIGIPFSDPTAEGPVIMQASQRALAGGLCTDDVLAMVSRIKDQVQIPLVFMTYANVVYSYGIERFMDGAARAGILCTDDVLAMVSRIKDQVQIPLVFMTYANVVYSYGIERFMDGAARAGISGLILPDVPFEEKDEFEIPACQAGIELISMIAPTSRERIEKIAASANGFLYCVSSLGVTGCRSEIESNVAGIELISMIAPTSRERIEKIAASANGFLYCVSSLGVTGCRSEIESNVEDMIVQVRKTNRIPCAIGFGIANEKQAAQMAAISDGVIVGSAIVALCAKYGQDAPVHAAKFVRSMKQAIASL